MLELIEMYHRRGEHCDFYPCHSGVRDFRCTFCYCPIYPCGMEETGGKWIEGANGKRVWDCSECTIVHEGDFVDKIKAFFLAKVREELKY